MEVLIAAKAGKIKIAARVIEGFRSGAGVGWNEHDPALFRGTERFFRPGYVMNLVGAWFLWKDHFTVAETVLMSLIVFAPPLRRLGDERYATAVLSGHIFPRDVLVDAWLTRQPEHPLTENVAHDFGGAAFDRVRTRPEELVLRQRHFVAVLAHRPT